jgi:WD40 repeat protein
VALSPSLRTLIGYEKDGDVFAWDLQSNAQVSSFKVFDDDFPRTVVGAFSPDESKMAVATRGSHAVYDVATGNVVSSLELDEGAEVIEVAFLNEEQLAGCVRGGNLHIWDTATGAVMAEHEISTVRLSDDGQMALALDEKPDAEGRSVLNAIAIHETLTGALIREIPIDEHIVLQNNPYFPVRTCDFDPEGEHVLLAAYQPDGPIVAFNIASGEMSGRVPQGMSVSLNMRPITELRALTSSFDDLVHVWDLNRPGERRVVDQPDKVRQLDMTADGRFGVTLARAVEEIHLWDLETGIVAAIFKMPTKARFLWDVCISDDGNTILSHDRETVWRIDAATGGIHVVEESPFGNDVAIGRLRMSGDGSAAVATSESGTMVFDPVTGAIQMTTKSVRHVDISRDGSFILAGNTWIDRNLGSESTLDIENEFNAQMSDDGSRAIENTPFYGSTVWNLATNSTLPGAACNWKYAFSGPAAGCDLSEDGRFVACGDEDGQLAIYDTQERKHLATVAIDDSEIVEVVVSADGSSIFLATHMGRLHHFRLENLPGASAEE